MGKVIALILFALGARVNAEEDLNVILLDRASNSIVDFEVDLDDATLAKPAKAAAKSTTGIKGTVASKKGTYKAINTGSSAPKKLFGGTNTLMAGKGQAIQEGAALPSYWGGQKSQKGIGYGWSVGGKKVNAGPEIVRQTYTPPKKKKFQTIAKRDTAPKKLFGGTNTLMAGKGQAIQETPATPSYWGGKKSDKGLGYGWFNKKPKALPEVQPAPFKAQPPPAPGIGGARPQTTMGARPLIR